MKTRWLVGYCLYSWRFVIGSLVNAQIDVLLILNIPNSFIIIVAERGRLCGQSIELFPYVLLRFSKNYLMLYGVRNH